MIKVYIDDSHMGDVTSAVYVLAGWAAPVTTWIAFSDDWHAVLNMSPKIRYFKFDEAMGLDGEFLGISPELRNEKLSLLVGVLQDHNPLGIASIIQSRVFESLFGKRHDTGVMKNPYTISFYQIISRLVRHYVSIGTKEKIEFVFDHQGAQMNKVLAAWEEFLRLSPPEYKDYLTSHPPSFHSDKDVVALQAADLHAGWVHMLDSAAILNKPIPQPIWGSKGEAMVRLFWELNEENAEKLYEALYKRKPVRFSYLFQYPFPPLRWRARQDSNL
jgi:Protein of unknown function (DUF3800)